MIRRKQVVGDRDKPGHDTFVTQVTLRRTNSDDSIVFGRRLARSPRTGELDDDLPAPA